MKNNRIGNSLKAVLAFGVIAMSVIACSEKQDAPVVEEEVVEEVAETPVDAPQFNDAQIAHIVVIADQIDVDYGKVALEKSKNEEVIHFAQSMVSDHEQIIKSATELVEKLGVTPEDNDLSKSLLEGQQTILEQFKGLEGAEFDKAYIDNEVAYHEAVIGAVKEILIPSAQNQELKQALTDVMPLLEHHLEMAKMAQAKIQ